MASPSERTDFVASQAAYDTKAHGIDGFELVFETPTLKAFKNNDAILLAIRGTADVRDLKADASLVVGRLSRSARYLADKTTCESIFKQWSPSQYNYFITGHSLGSALGIQLQKDFPFIKGGVFFNGALQPQDLLNQNASDKELYTDNDPLYQTIGRFYRYKEVIPASGLVNGDTLLHKAVNALKSHGLAQFKSLYGAGSSIAGYESTPLSDSDIRKVLGPNVSIMAYPQLRGIKHIEEAFDSLGRLVVLFETTSSNEGHWQGIYVSGPNEITFFDSYGMSPDDCFAWETPQQLQELHETRKEVVRLLKDAESRKIKVIVNRHRFQSWRPDISTCGRWVCLRLLFGFQSNSEFAKMIVDSGVTPDVFATVVTHVLINK